MMIRCVGCGYCVSVSRNGTAVNIEEKAAEMITDGWRYTSKHDGYACPVCGMYGIQNKFYELCCGSLEEDNAANSYKKLLQDMRWFSRKPVAMQGR